MILFLTEKDNFHVLQVIHRAVHWIQLWAFLLPSDQRDLIEAGCTRLLRVARDFSPSIRGNILVDVCSLSFYVSLLG